MSIKLRLINRRIGLNHFQKIKFDPVVRAHAAIRSYSSASELAKKILRDCLDAGYNFNKEAIAVYRDHLNKTGSIKELADRLDTELDMIVMPKEDRELSDAVYNLKKELGIYPG
jgi:hypothetical protein